MDLKQYKARLDKHDWHYASSHDSRWYEAGLAEEVELKRLASENKSFQKAYDAKVKKVFKVK